MTSTKTKTSKNDVDGKKSKTRQLCLIRCNCALCVCTRSPVLLMGPIALDERHSRYTRPHTQWSASIQIKSPSWSHRRNGAQGPPSG